MMYMYFQWLKRALHSKRSAYILNFQDIVLTLVSADNGSIGPNRNCILSIQPNDNPHGTLQFSADVYNVTEEITNSVQYLPLTRR